MGGAGSDPVLEQRADLDPVDLNGLLPLLLHIGCFQEILRNRRK